jgi:hypothetical protein
MDTLPTSKCNGNICDEVLPVNRFMVKFRGIGTVVKWGIVDISLSPTAEEDASRISESKRSALTSEPPFVEEAAKLDCSKLT